jgi:hypothetical protein
MLTDVKALRGRELRDLQLRSPLAPRSDVAAWVTSREQGGSVLASVEARNLGLGAVLVVRARDHQLLERLRLAQIVVPANARRFAVPGAIQTLDGVDDAAIGGMIGSETTRTSSWRS